MTYAIRRIRSSEDVTTYTRRLNSDMQSQIMKTVEGATRDLSDVLRQLVSELEEAERSLKDRQGQIEDLERQLLQAQENGRSWERKANRAQQDSGRDNTVRSVLEKLGEYRVLHYLDTMASDGTSAKAGGESANKVTPDTVRIAFTKWIRDVYQEPKRIFDGLEIELHRNDAASLCEFEPTNPFSDQSPKARFRVLSPGWQAGKAIIEKARLEFLSYSSEGLNEPMAISDTGYSDQAEDDDASPQQLISQTLTESQWADEDPLHIQASNDLGQAGQGKFMLSDEDEKAARVALESSEFWANMGKVSQQEESKYQKIMRAIFEASVTGQSVQTVLEGVYSERKRIEPARVIKALTDWKKVIDTSEEPRYIKFLSLYEDRPELKRFFEQRWNELLDETQGEGQ